MTHTVRTHGLRTRRSNTGQRNNRCTRNNLFVARPCQRFAVRPSEPEHIGTTQRLTKRLAARDRLLGAQLLLPARGDAAPRDRAEDARSRPLGDEPPPAPHRAVLRPRFGVPQPRHCHDGLVVIEIEIVICRWINTD